MTRNKLSSKIEAFGDEIINEYPIVGGILYILAGLTITGEEELLANSARQLVDFILERNNNYLNNQKK